MAFRKFVSAFIVTILLCSPFKANAEAPYKGYIYDSRGDAVSSPNGYVPEAIWSGMDMGVGDLNNPQDLFVDDKKNVYILDTGNNRIVKLDSNMHPLKTIDKFISDKGEEKLKKASGLFVDTNGDLIIADTGNGRILISDQDGKVRTIIGKPQSNLIPADFRYEPVKVAVSSSKIIYVLSNGTNLGALTMDETGAFLGFFGSNNVEKSLELLSEMFWRSIASKQQLAKMQKFTPVQFTNFDIDKDDFVYTVTKFMSGSEDGLVRKLNPGGNNILTKKQYGDLMLVGRTSTTLVDITVDKEGFFYALDRDLGRIFGYDQESNLLFIFGGKDSKKGMFDDPVAVTNLNGNIMVLDAAKNNVTVFRPTAFASAVRDAVTLYSRGKYEEALEPWKQILMWDSNFDLAYIGLGKALYNLHDYKEAMNAFKIGNDKDSYSKAKRKYRTVMLRQHFTQIVLALLAGSVLYLLIRYRKKWLHLWPRRKENRSEFEVV